MTCGVPRSHQVFNMQSKLPVIIGVTQITRHVDDIRLTSCNVIMRPTGKSGQDVGGPRKRKAGNELLVF